MLYREQNYGSSWSTLGAGRRWTWWRPATWTRVPYPSSWGRSSRVWTTYMGRRSFTVTSRRVHLDILSFLFVTPTIAGGQCVAQWHGGCQARRLRGGWAADQYHQQEEHIRGDALLDGAWSDQTIRSVNRIRALKSHLNLMCFSLWRQGWRLVPGHHRHRAGQGGASQLRSPPHEGPLPHSQEQSTAADREFLQTVQRVCRGLLKQRSRKCKYWLLAFSFVLI